MGSIVGKGKNLGETEQVSRKLEVGGEDESSN